MSTPSNKKATHLQQLVNGLLIIVILGLLAFASTRFKTELDWTANKRNTLTASSVTLLKAMPDPITFYVFAPSGADIRRAVSEDLGKYQRVKKDLSIEYVDPSLSPQKVREFNISFVGEVVAEYQGRRENLTATTEQAITTALQRLSTSGDHFVVFIQGHGERGTADQKPDGYARFAQVLQDKGLKVQPINLIQTTAIPDNASLAVLAAPSAKLLPGEVKIIRDYVQKGGNLLWLTDPDAPAEPAELAQDLGVQWQNGYVIMPEYQLIGTGHPGIFAAINYPPNAVTQGLDMVTLFPFARSVGGQGADGWTLTPLLQTSEAAWLETGNIESGHVTLDDDDIRGPLNIGVTLTKMLDAPKADSADAQASDAKPRQQRIALVGDADFLANAYLGELGNQQLGINLIQWLASRDAQLNIDVKKAPDTSLFLPGWAMMSIAGFFVLLLPLGLLGFGVTRWILRRRR